MESQTTAQENTYCGTVKADILRDGDGIRAKLVPNDEETKTTIDAYKKNKCGSVEAGKAGELVADVIGEVTSNKPDADKVSTKVEEAKVKEGGKKSRRRRKRGGRKSKRRTGKKARKSKKSKRRSGKKSKRRRRRK